MFSVRRLQYFFVLFRWVSCCKGLGLKWLCIYSRFSLWTALICSIFVIQAGRCASSLNTFIKITVWYTVPISVCSSPGTHSINPAQCLGKAEWIDFNSNDFQLVLVQEVGGHTAIQNKQSIITTGLVLK